MSISKTVNLPAFLFFAALISCGGAMRAQAPNGTLKLNLKTAAGATELPLGPWGSYSTGHAGPCYLASRRLAPLFSFPIVVGQQRDEVLPIGGRDADGKIRVRPERITLLRRAAGLSPAAAPHDAVGDPVIARITDADADGLLTTAHIEFAAARPSQDISRRRDAQGAPAQAESWPAGTATVTWSPAFADNDTEGLIIRVTLTNAGQIPQEFFVDMLGGLDKPDPLYAVTEFSAEPDPDGRGITLKHAKFGTVLALAAQSGDFVTHAFTVSDDVFTAGANSGIRDAGSGVLPRGITNTQGAWALMRVSGIVVGAGETRTVALSVGLGKDADGALTSARTLLSLAEDRKPAALPGREGLFSLADKAHARSRYRAAGPALDRLMAQSVTNVPFREMRRVGVPTRDGAAKYEPGVGGWMAMGWSGYRPDWAAAQINAWLLTATPPQKAINHAIAVTPIDIFALWDLAQRTHDRDMLEKFYPYAVWRFREFLEAGREREDSWLFTWPLTKDKLAAQTGPLYTARAAGLFTCDFKPDMGVTYAPDYSAYVILSARILLACARILDKNADEQATFAQVIEKASHAMTKELWDAKRGLFVAKPILIIDAVTVMDRADMALGSGIECVLPLIVGRELLTADQDAALRKNLQDSASFLSAAGLRSLSKKSGAYRADDGERGGVRFGTQWLFWKALLDRGETAHAADLASRILMAYEAAARSSGGCPEWLNGDLGDACGRLDSTGDACSLLALSEAYHRPGTVSCGWDTRLLDDHYDGASDTLRVVFRALVSEPKGTLLCVMGKPGAAYHVSGGITGSFTADAAGVIALPMPNDRTTQQIEISAAGGQK